MITYADEVLKNAPALSVRQPWAELITSGRKCIEIRSWSTDYRGPIWIHASGNSDAELDREFGLRTLFRGGYVGIATLAAVVPFSRERWEEWQDLHLDSAPYRVGLYGWVLIEPRKLGVPVRDAGRLKLYWPEANIIDRILRENASDVIGEMH